MIKYSGNPKIDKHSKSLKELLKIILDSSTFKYENCASQLMQVKLKPGQEMEICVLFFEICFERNSYSEHLGHITQVRFNVHLYQLLFTILRYFESYYFVILKIVI